MSEARIRNLAQSQSNIFTGGPPAQKVSSIKVNSRDSFQTESYIFTPEKFQPKPMTYAREKYNRATICLGTDYEQVDPCRSSNAVQSPSRVHSGLSPAGKRTNQESSTKYLLGNDRSNFYKKSVNDHLGVPDNFEPIYDKSSAFERKQREFNDGFSPKRQEKVLQDQDICFTAKDRKLNDRVSIFDSNNYSIPTKPTVNPGASSSAKPPTYNPGTRKSEILSSSVFEERRVHDFKRPETVQENDDERRKNHNYSDLFGRPTSPSKPVERIRNQGNRKDEEYDPRNQANKMLTSNVEIGNSPRRIDRARTPNVVQKERPKDFTSSASRKQEELATSFTTYKPPGNPQVIDLSLASIPSNINSNDVKDLCGGVHLVSLALDIDNFTGKTRGTGKMRLRTTNEEDLSKLRRIFAAKGIQVERNQENLGRKNNYADVAGVNWHNTFDNKRASTPGGAREIKMKSLESNVLGGGSKWVERPRESFDNELNAQILWKNTKNPRNYYE